MHSHAVIHNGFAADKTLVYHAICLCVRRARSPKRLDLEQLRKELKKPIDGCPDEAIAYLDSYTPRRYTDIRDVTEARDRLIRKMIAYLKEVSSVIDEDTDFRQWLEEGITVQRQDDGRYMYAHSCSSARTSDHLLISWSIPLLPCQACIRPGHCGTFGSGGICQSSRDVRPAEGIAGEIS